jgi:hypothetical protein
VEELPSTRRFDAGKTEVLTTPASTATAAPAELRPSGPIERYVAGEEIARGGMGRVVAGTDTRLGREVAIKEALPAGGDLERFEREVRITARLEHPSIVPLYDAGVSESGRPFYVMRKVSGQPLDRLIAEQAPSEPGLGPRLGRPRRAADQRLALVPHVLAAAQALGHAHRRGVVHRDVKPANILVGELGETFVIDWGLAKVIGEDEAGPAPPIDGALAPSGEVATQTGAVFGTPSYMAPEQARSEPLDARSDVYALGATLCHVLTGRPPLPGALTEVLASAHDPERAAPALAQLAELALPPELTAIVDKAMQFDPARRYPDGAALADDLNRFLAGRLVAAHRYTVAERLARFVRRHRALVAVIAGSALVLVTGGVLAIRGILLERERAWLAEQAAIAGQRAAEAAREREADRADDAVIIKASIGVDRDPTSAIAALATLGPGSRRWPFVRPIAIEARLRGIARVYRASRPPRSFELGPDPRLLLIAGSTPGQVSILDLEHGRDQLLDGCPGRCAAAWGERGAAVWIGPAEGGLYAIDVATGARRAPVMSADGDHVVTELRADPAATLVGFALSDGRAGMIDERSVHYLARLTGKVEQLRIAPDGSWAAFASRSELVIADRSGRELAREPGPLRPETLTAAASLGQVAILTGGGAVVELDVAGGRATARRTTLGWGVIWLTFVKDRLYINLNNASQMRPLHDLGNRWLELPHMWSNRETWQGDIAIASDSLQLIGPTARSLLSPVHDSFVAVAGRRDARYLAVHTRSLLLTWDLGEVLPSTLATGMSRAWLFDDRTAIISPQGSMGCEWLDLETGARTPIAAPDGLLLAGRSDPATGRALLLYTTSGHPLVAVLVYRGRSEVTPVDVPDLHRIDFAGSDLLAGTTTGEVVRIGPGAARHTVYRFPAPVDGVASNGPWILAQDETGSLARIHTTTGAIDTLSPAFPVQYMVVTATGDVLLGGDRTLHRWRGRDVQRIATLPARITLVEPIEDRDSYVVITQSHETFTVAPDRSDDQRVVRLFLRSSIEPRISLNGRYLAVNTANQETVVFDLTRGAQWRMPLGERIEEISPSGRTALLFQDGRISVAHLDMPDDPAQLRDWIVHATNYTADAIGP